MSVTKRVPLYPPLKKEGIHNGTMMEGRHSLLHTMRSRDGPVLAEQRATAFVQVGGWQRRERE